MQIRVVPRIFVPLPLNGKGAFFMERGATYLPIIIAQDLPAAKVLKQETIYAIKDQQAKHQDIRPMKIGIINLMPDKIQTETQLLRLLSMSPLQIDVRLLRMTHHVSKHTSQAHLTKFYATTAEMKAENLDGLIITGAPIEQKPFEEIDYWDELCDILEWSQTHCTSVMHICWGAQAAMYHHYNIKKTRYREKLLGVFEQTIVQDHPTLRGFSKQFYCPHSRFTGIDEQALQKSDLDVLATSHKTGPAIVASKNQKNLFLFGHLEYETDTLLKEYQRDLMTGKAKKPEHYFIEDDPNKGVINTWQSHASLFFLNWIHDTYQRTPFDETQIGQVECRLTEN